MDKLIGINVLVSMSRTLYISVPDTNTEEQNIELAKKDLVLPLEALEKANSIFRKYNIKVSQLDLNDWEMKDINYNIIKDN